MNTYKNITDDEFFIIDSNNINSIKTEFYGYGIAKDKIIRKSNFNSFDELNGTGAYIFIESNNEAISLFQDHVGSYGLYLYKYDDYFAISNSFLKLTEFLSKSDKPISLNEDYTNYYLSVELTVFVPDETLINEITMLPRNCIVHIDKESKKLTTEELDYEENTISLDTEEGINLLDEWYFRWVELFRALRKKTNTMRIDLSGGFDTRIVSAIWLTSNINLNNIRINSSARERRKEDLEIASEIAEHFNFKLNFSKKYKFKPISIIESINAQLYPQFGFHKSRFWKPYKFEETNYRISGHCGGIIRSYPNNNLKEYEEKHIRRAKMFDKNIYESTKKLFGKKNEENSAKYNLDINSKELAAIFYKNSRNRHHFGKQWVGDYLYNLITLTPLSDSDLMKLKPNTDSCKDDLLLFTLILIRYCPDLINFKVEGNRHFNEKTIKYANKINNKFPFKPKNYDYIEGPELDDKFENEKIVFKTKDIKTKFEEIFYSKNFIKEFEKYFTRQSYNRIKKNTETKKRIGLIEIYGSIDIIKTIEYVKLNNSLNSQTIGDWLNTYEIIPYEDIEIDELIKKYRTLRMDIKNLGSNNNDIIILETSDKFLIEQTPKWFGKTNGVGHVITTKIPNLDMKIKIINDGKLELRLRGTNVKDKNGKIFPVYIDCKSLKINEKNILNTNTLVCCDEYYKFEKEVKDGEIINIHIEWLPFNESSIYTTPKIDSMAEKLNSKNKELEMLQKKGETEIFNYRNLKKRLKRQN